MKEYVLNYYPLFKCVAERCRHTCCADWEICIDEQSLISYKNEKTNFSESLKSGINFKKSKFKSDKNKRCAFLNNDGLCEIIKNLGEDRLCQVCREHPRFRSFFYDRTELGLGFCCEEATNVILSFKEKIEPVLVADDEKENAPDFIQNGVLQFRKKAFDILQERTANINQRINSLLKECNAKLSEKNFKKIIKYFLRFEKLDKNWAKWLKAIKNEHFSTIVDESLSHYCEQFLVNGIFRHISDAEDTILARAITLAQIIAWFIIQNVAVQEKTFKANAFKVISEVIRAYSAEVEYSQKNLKKLFTLSNEYI